MKNRLEWIIFYFEGTCEICLGNMGIERYRSEIRKLMDGEEAYDDETRAMLHFALAVIQYKVDNLEEAFSEWNECIKYAKKCNNELYLAKSYSYLAIYYYIKKEKENEKYYFDTATEILTKLELYIELALHYINILWFKRYEKDTTETIEYMEKALQYVQKSDSKKNARVYLHLGYIYKTIFNDFIKGIKYLVLSNELCRKNGFVEMESMTFHVLADGYLQLSHYQETIKIYRDILENPKFMNITPNLKSSIISNLITCYLELKDVDNVKKYIAELEELIPHVQVNIMEQYYAVSMWLRVQLYLLEKKHLETASKLLEECNFIYEKYQSNFIIEEFDYKLYSISGDLYMLLEDYRKATYYYDKMAESAKKYSDINKKEAFKRLSCVYMQSGNYEKALAYCKKVNELFDHIKGINMNVQYEKLYKEFIRSIKDKEIQQLNKKQASLKEDVYIDELTKVYNRNFYSEYIQLQKSYAKDQEKVLTALMVDIDCFKKYNDNYGHVKGDQVLYQIAQILKGSCCRLTNKTIRYGGDEFIIFLEDASKEDSEEVVEAIRSSLSDAKIIHEYSDIDEYVTVSIGIAQCMLREEENVEKLVEECDEALYEVKKKGRNGYAYKVIR